MTTYTKYPRTKHLPWSQGRGRDDLVLASTSAFEGQQVVVTEKRDGENTTMYADKVHARSLDSPHHDSRSWVTNLHARIGYNIPKGWRVCGENLYARHSIAYELATYFEVFSIWDEKNCTLSWNDTVEWATLLGLHTVPVLYEGLWPGQKRLEELWGSLDSTSTEGFVVRLTASFPYASFPIAVAKFVRPNHVTTETHWKRHWVPNKLC